MSTRINSTPTTGTQRGWAFGFAAALLAAATLAVGACGDDSSSTPAAPTPTPTPTATPAVVRSGTVSQAPAGKGLMHATLFTLAAEGFSSSDGAALTYSWDFGNGDRRTAGPSVAYVYSGTGTFNVTATATNTAGTSAAATLNGLQVGSVTGRWGLKDAAGAFILRSTWIDQNGTRLSGDDTGLNCKFTVTGAVATPRAVTVTYTRPVTDCAGRNLPVTQTFTGVMDQALLTMAGTLSTGGAASMVRCDRPGCD